MKLLGRTEDRITKDKNGENVPHLEITEVVLFHYNIVNNDYQQDSRVMYKFVPKKISGSLLEISPTNNIFLKTSNSEFQDIEVWLTDQNSQTLEIKDRINLTLVIKLNIYWIRFYRIKMIEPKHKIYVKGYGFLSFAKNIV